MKEMQKLEPYVEVVDKSGIMSDDCPILDIDLQTCTLEDLEFSNRYKIKINEKCYINSICGWFDVFFSFGETRVRLTTSKPQ